MEEFLVYWSNGIHSCYLYSVLLHGGLSPSFFKITQPKPRQTTENFQRKKLHVCFLPSVTSDLS